VETNAPENYLPDGTEFQMTAVNGTYDPPVEMIEIINEEAPQPEPPACISLARDGNEVTITLSGNTAEVARVEIRSAGKVVASADWAEGKTEHTFEIEGAGDRDLEGWIILNDDNETEIPPTDVCKVNGEDEPIPGPWAEISCTITPNPVRPGDPQMSCRVANKNWWLPVTGVEARVQLPSLMRDVRDVSAVLWDGSALGAEIRSNPEWGEGWERYIEVNVGNLEPAKLDGRYYADFSFWFDIAGHTAPGSYQIKAEAEFDDGQGGRLWNPTVIELEVLPFWGDGPRPEAGELSGYWTQKADGSLFYTVGRGDHLWWVATEAGVGLQDLIDTNTLVDPDFDPNVIEVGQEILIPGA
ncbi:hypothetical protein B5M47_02415, partial [candidate division CPR3 bacterium 4484_211]